MCQVIIFKALSSPLCHTAGSETEQQCLLFVFHFFSISIAWFLLKRTAFEGWVTHNQVTKRFWQRRRGRGNWQERGRRGGVALVLSGISGSSFSHLHLNGSQSCFWPPTPPPSFSLFVCLSLFLSHPLSLWHQSETGSGSAAVERETERKCAGLLLPHRPSLQR